MSELDRRILMHEVAHSFVPVRRLTLEAPDELGPRYWSSAAVGTVLETHGSGFLGVDSSSPQLTAAPGCAA